jgi:hypothetical protein
VYRRKLSESGVLAWHLSNRYLDLEPVLANFIQETGAAGLIRTNISPMPELGSSANAYPTIWAAIAAKASDLGELRNDSRWRPLRTREGVGVWTDDFSNIFSVFIWSVPRSPIEENGTKSVMR